MQINTMEPKLLLSIINMKLRDQYDSLEELCDDLDLDVSILIEKFNLIDYIYSINHNQFISK